tara:strand:- start:11037 stop:11723 length:687 start_codon:yes stop_codon:yes gene_type:complete
MSQNDDHKPDDIALIGEYALHLLDADERRVVDQRLLAEPALRALLRDWDEGFVPLADEFDEVAPPSTLKAQIEAQLFADTKLASLWSRLFAWNAAWVAVAAVVVAFVGVQLFTDTNAPTYVAEIVAEDRGLVVQARFDPKTANLDISRVIGSISSGRSHELWLIIPESKAVVSLGVMPVTQQGVMVVPKQYRAQMIGGTLAISDEPLGGSPTGVATGAILAIGGVVLL